MSGWMTSLSSSCGGSNTVFSVCTVLDMEERSVFTEERCVYDGGTYFVI